MLLGRKQAFRSTLGRAPPRRATRAAASTTASVCFDTSGNPEGSRTSARFNYASDDVQERYDVTGERTPFETRLRAAERRLKRLPNYRSYLACGGDHCVLPDDRFYRLRVGGVALRDWTRNLAAGRNVGCPTCPGR